jgi:hypothetical protein
MNKLVLKIYELDYLIDFLPKLKLVDYESRMRSRFYKLLLTRYQQFLEEKEEVIKECAEIGEDGKPVMTTIDEDKSGIKIKDYVKFQNSMLELSNEEYIVEIDDNNHKMIKTVTKNILNCGLSFEGDESLLYDEICEKFEQLEFEGDDNEQTN